MAAEPDAELLQSPPKARVRPSFALRTFVLLSVVTVHLWVFVDSAIRWERGVDFLARAEWQRTAIALLVVYVALGSFVLVRFARTWLTTPIGFVLACTSYCASAAGGGVFDWREAPLIWFTIGNVPGIRDWFTALDQGGGFRVALWAALAQTLVVVVCRRTRGLGRVSAVDACFVVAGLTFLMTALATPPEFVFVYDDRRPRIISEVAAVSHLRNLARVALGALGAGLALVGAVVHVVRTHVGAKARRRGSDRTP